MKKKLIFLIIIGIVVIAIFLVKFLTAERNFLINDIRQLKIAVEKKNKNMVLSYVDKAYQDKNDLSYNDLIAGLDNLFNDYDSIKITLNDMKTKIDSIDKEKCIYASCSLGLKIFGRYQDDRVLIFGGFINPAPVHACFKKTQEHYKVYYAEY